MLGKAEVHTMLPVKDLKGAAKFYESVLGLEKVHEMPEGAVTYQCGAGQIVVYVSEFAGTNKGTAASWSVPDVETLAADLKKRGVSFEHYDMPGMTRRGDVHEAGPMKLAWFKDPAGNILGLEGRA